MGLHHNAPGEVLNLVELNDQLPRDATCAIARTNSIEVIRMVLPKGRKVPQHHAPGEITVQCLKGHVTFSVEGSPLELHAADWLFLLPNQQHELEAHEDSVVLVTMRR
jgi:quercetin dioxygenase-like cupin family protein